MCSGDDANCLEFELHRQKLLDGLDGNRIEAVTFLRDKAK